MICDRLCSLDRKHEGKEMWFGCGKERRVMSQRTTAEETGFTKAYQLSQVIHEPTRVINGSSTTATVKDLFISSNFILRTRKVTFPR